MTCSAGGFLVAGITAWNNQFSEVHIQCSITPSLFGRRNAYSEMSGIQIDRFEEEKGKIVEEWAEFDLLGAMRQLGAIPEPQQEAGS